MVYLEKMILHFFNFYDTLSNRKNNRNFIIKFDNISGNFFMSHLRPSYFVDWNKSVSARK